MDFAKVNELSKKYEPRMTRFLRDMIAIPSESCQEEGVIKRIKKEMEDVGFDRVEIDKMGKVIGYMGNGPAVLLGAYAFENSNSYRFSSLKPAERCAGAAPL